MSDSVALKGASLDLPAFTRGCEQLPPSPQVEGTKNSKHKKSFALERIIGAVHQRFQTLSATGVLQRSWYLALLLEELF